MRWRTVLEAGTMTHVFSDDPFPQAFSALKESQGKTFRQLAAETRAADPASKGLAHTYIARLAGGRDYPLPHAIELLSAVLDVEPSYFAEYRLAQFRAHFDERVLDLDVALAQLSRVLASFPDLGSGSPPTPRMRRARRVA